MTDKDYNYSESYVFTDNQQRYGDESNVQASSLNNSQQLSEQQIQQEIEAISKQSQNSKRDQVIFPSLQRLEDNFDTFTKNKEFSFLLFSFHPYFKGRFDQNDIKDIFIYTQQYKQNIFYFTMFTTIGLYAICETIQKKRAIFGLTNTGGMAGFLFKYYLAPKMITSCVDPFVFKPPLQRNTAPILQKYNYEQELKTNPQYKKAHEDFKLFQQSKEYQEKNKDEK